MKLTLLTVSCGLAAVLAAPLEGRADYAVHSSHFVPSGWTKAGKAHADQVLKLRIGLKQGNFQALEEDLLEVSHPDHERYGKHLSSDEIHSHVAPSEAALDAVHQWLGGHDIFADQLEYSAPKDWVMVSLPISKVEKLLDTEYHQYEHIDGTQVVRTTQYSLPRSLQGHVDIVAPTNYFGNPKFFGSTVRIAEGSIPNTEIAASSLASSAAPLGCLSTAVTLACVRSLYQTIDYKPKVPNKNYVGITNYLNQTPSDVDFRAYMTTQRPDANPNYIFTRQIIAGAANDQTMPGIEADLDVEAVGGIAYPTRFTSYSTGGSPPFTPDLATPTDTNEPYLTWLDYVLKQKDVPYVISTSYGDDEQSVPQDYATRVCNELAQLGAKGVTLLFSSGDFGVGASGDCVSNDGKNTPRFLPAFPASCPYVTTVGGTMNFSPEVVAKDGGYIPGGGFSNYFPRPSYQDAAVSSYLSSIGTLNQPYYNASGRAYPDIAAQSVRFVINNMAAPNLVDGTSVASPISAGVLTLVNDALIAAGKPPLGFLNPMLYSKKGAGFTDITSGTVTGCNATTPGFPARKGWDAASGFGTPNFKAIRASLGV
ncbi:unnamed protein product [Zymoseptoria tritici ST99CH_1E4]|uniref:tripeptidyl-peptidase II n=1 Tax=Zymoseptoria tritici ST99CH_1E4 TaxID=1276532 RepID=A0A2H1FNF7_ZYMTR|nr:unnamed protein product [Zymoseptoria tritici ST99CH_1E4]